jgi:hypothetical protein
MPILSLFMYVEGSDLEEVFPVIEAEGHRLLTSRTWSVPTRFISTHFPRTANLHPDDLPDWNLGFNLDLARAPDALKAAASDIRAIGEFASAIHRRTGRIFIFGTYDPKTHLDEDLAFVSDDPSEVEGFMKMVQHVLAA